MKQEDIANDPAFEELERKPQAPPVTSAQKASIDSRAAEWQEKTDQAVESALLGLPELVGGVSLFPFTTARGSLLRRIGNEFVQGVKIESIEDPFMSVGRFLAIMSVPLSDARKLATTPDALEDVAYGILDSISLGSVSAVVGEVNDFVKRAMANQVYGTPYDSDGEKSAPPGPKN